MTRLKVTSSLKSYSDIYILFFNYRERKRRNEWKSGQRDEFSRDEHWRRIVSRVSRGESTSYLTYRRIKTA